MKHFLILALTAIMTLTMMTGCRNKNNAESAIDDVATTISEGLNDMTDTQNTDNTAGRRVPGTENTETTHGNTHARNRRGINR